MSRTEYDAAYLDILVPGFRPDGPEVAAARQRNWYARTDLGILVLRYAEAAEIDGDQRFGPSGSRDREMHGLTEGPIYDWFTYNMQNVGYARHAVLRKLLKRTVSPHVVHQLRPFARATAQTMIDKITGEGAIEWMESFAEPFPVAVLWQILGSPEAQDFDEFSRVSADTGLILGLSLHDDQIRSRAAAAVSALDAYVRRLLHDSQQRGGSDPLTRLISEASRGADPLSYRELHNLVMTLIMGGHETTSRQLGWLAVAFAQNPDQWLRLRRHPELVSQAAWEVMRWGTVVQINKRWALRDITYKGVDIPAGSLVMVCHAAANRDPQIYTDPDRFDISKARQAPPLTFGRGPHRCVGAALAHMEICEVLRTLSRRLEPPVITDAVSWRPHTTTMFGPERVPLRFTLSRAKSSRMVPESKMTQRAEYEKGGVTA